MIVQVEEHDFLKMPGQGDAQCDSSDVHVMEKWMLGSKRSSVRTAKTASV